MKNLLLIFIIIPFTVFGQSSEEYQKMSLEELNEFLFSEYVLKGNTEPLEQLATDDFVLIAAPGMLETKDQVIGGVKNLDISSLLVTVDKKIESEGLGVIIGTLEMQGTIMNRPVPGKIRFSSTFIKVNGEWRLKMRTMTPMRM